MVTCTWRRRTYKYKQLQLIISIFGGNGGQILSNAGFNNVTFKYDSVTADQLNNELSGDTINGGFYRGPTDFNSSNTVGLGPNDMLKFDNNLAISYNGTLFSNFVSNQSISASAGNSFAGGGGLEFGLLNLSGNVIVAFDRDLSGAFSEGDLALDVQDNVTVSYI